MARFRFSLEPLLRLRRRREQECQRDVAVLERERLHLEGRLRRYQEELAAGKDSLRERLVGRVDTEALRRRAGQSRQILRSAQQAVVELAGVQKRLERARATLLEATTERRAVELLRERRFDAWKRRLEKAETAAIDELAVQAAARRET
jgi:flagellar FliJ protein